MQLVKYTTTNQIDPVDVAVRIERHIEGFTVWHDEVEQQTYETYGAAIRSLDGLTQKGLAYWII